MNYLKLFILSLLLCSCMPVFSQQKFKHTWYTADNNNLPQNSVKSIIKDKYGYIWLSTENGLVRFDGQAFFIYGPKKIPGLISNRMQYFAGSTDKDSIYILNESKQLLLISKREITNLRKKLPQPYADLKDILGYNYNPVPSLTFTEKGLYLDIPVKDKLYIIGNDSIKLYNNKKKRISELAYSYPERSQFFTLENALYLDNKTNIIKFSGVKTTTLNFDRVFKHPYYVFTNNACAQSFIYCNKQLFFLKQHETYIETLLVSDNLDIPDNNIVSFFYDETCNSLYLGSSNKGLLVIEKQGFYHISPTLKHTIGTDGVYYALTKFKDDKVLSSTGEIFKKDGETTKNNIAGFSDKYMLVIDNNEDIWTKNSRNLYQFKNNSNYNNYNHWKLNVSITCMTKAPDGKIWFGTFNEEGKTGGFIYYIDTKKANCKPQFFLHVKEAPACIAVFNNTIWTGTWKGLYKYSIAEKKATKIKDFPTCQVRSLYVEPTGEVWATTYGKGFFLLKDNRTTSFPTDKNGYLLTSHCIMEDANGYLWITTNKGLFQVKKQDVLNYADNKIEEVYYHYYNKNSGFPNNEFNGGCQPCGVYLNYKTFFFPSMEGVVYFNTSDISPILPNNPIYIDEVSIDNKLIFSSDNIILNQNFGRISFTISSPYYGEPYNENIEFMLYGPVKQEWTPLTEKSVSFSTLPHGEYILKTRKLKGFGSQWIYKDIRFVVEPAFWQTSWFIILAVISTFILIFLIIKLRISYIRYKNTILENKVILQTAQLQETITTLRKTKDDLSKQIENHKRLIKSITHDIKSPLKFLSITGRYIYNNIDNDKESVKENLQAMYTSSFQLYHFVDNFLEYAKETNINDNESSPYSLYNLAKEKISFFKNIAQLQKTQLFNEIPVNYTTRINRHLLSIILHNLIDNATKNTFDGRVTLSAVADNNTLSISVRDSGKGMTKTDLIYYNNLLQGYINPEEENSKGMGLPMVAELLNILEGKTKIISPQQGGTEIVITFKL